MYIIIHIYLGVVVDRLFDSHIFILLSQYVRVHFGLSMFIISS
jgi:hypothetical protein